jgi:hypothetical protein
MRRAVWVADFRHCQSFEAELESSPPRRRQSGRKDQDAAGLCADAWPFGVSNWCAKAPAPGSESAGAGAVAAPMARQVEMRLLVVRRCCAATGECCRAFPAFDSSTMVWLRARHRGQYVIASQEALGATVNPHREHSRTDNSARTADAARSFTPASSIAASTLWRAGWRANGGPSPILGDLRWGPGGRGFESYRSRVKQPRFATSVASHPLKPRPRRIALGAVDCDRAVAARYG